MTTIIDKTNQTSEQQFKVGDWVYLIHKKTNEKHLCVFVRPNQNNVKLIEIDKADSNRFFDKDLSESPICISNEKLNEVLGHYYTIQKVDVTIEVNNPK